MALWEVSSKGEKWKELTDLFILSRKALGLAPGTIKDYEDHVNQFIERTRLDSFDDMKLCRS